MYPLLPPIISTPMAFALLAVVLGMGLVWCLRYNGQPVEMGRFSAFGYAWVLASLVYGLVPFVSYLADGTSYRKAEIGAVLPSLLVAQALGLMALLSGYRLGQSGQWIRASIEVVPKPRISMATVLVVMMYLFTALVLAELVYSMGSLDFLDPNNQVKAEGVIYHLVHKISGIKGLADSLILILIVAPYYHVKRRYWVPIAVVFIVVALLEGIRYRAVLLLLGWAVLYLPSYWAQIRLRAKWTMVGLVLLVALSIQLWSANRWALANKQYQYLTINPIANGSDPLSEFGQTYVGAACLQFSQAERLGPDYGATSIGYILVRFTPKFIWSYLGFTDPETGAKPFPPMLHRVVQGAGFGHYATGVPAYGALQEMFLSFGWWSVLLWASIGWLWGRLWACLSNKAFYYTLIASYQPWLTGLGVVWWFQWITRGYLPQQVELLLFLAFPLVLIILINLVWFKQYSSTQLSDHAEIK